jgi:hypothetical protein
MYRLRDSGVRLEETGIKQLQQVETKKATYHSFYND